MVASSDSEKFLQNWLFSQQAMKQFTTGVGSTLDGERDGDEKVEQGSSSPLNGHRNRHGAVVKLV